MERYTEMIIFRILTLSEITQTLETNFPIEMVRYIISFLVDVKIEQVSLDPTLTDTGITVKENRVSLSIQKLSTLGEFALGNKAKQKGNCQFWEVVISKLGPFPFVTKVGMGVNRGSQDRDCFLIYADHNRTYNTKREASGQIRALCIIQGRVTSSNQLQDVIISTSDRIGFFYNPREMEVHVFHNRKYIGKQQLNSDDWRPCIKVGSPETEAILIKQEITPEVIKKILPCL
jgi:hypothetical protein